MCMSIFVLVCKMSQGRLGVCSFFFHIITLLLSIYFIIQQRMKKQTKLPSRATPQFSQEMQRKQEEEKKRKRIHFLAQEKEIRMPRQKLLCAEMKKEQIKRVIIIERKAVWIGGGGKRIKYKNKNSFLLLLVPFLSFLKKTISYSFFLFESSSLYLFSCESIEKACFSLLVPHSHIHIYKHTQTINITEKIEHNGEEN